MTLAIRIIPTILCRGRQLVKGERFQSWRSVGHALQACRIHQSRGVDEIVLLDIAATQENRGPDVQLIRELSDILFAPLAVGGGIRKVEDVREVLLAGADKVVVCSAALRRPDVIREMAEEFGSQAIVVSIDVRDGKVCADNGKHKFPIGPKPWALAMELSGAGEILLQDVTRDGTMQGYNIDLIRQVSQAVSIPVVASGGCSGPADMFNAIAAGASAVAAGALFQFSDETPKSCALYLKANGIEVRL